MTGRIELRPTRIARYAAVTALLAAVTVFGSRALLARVLPEPTQAAELLAGLVPRPPMAPATLLRTPPVPEAPPARGSRLASVLSTGRLRVGFDADSVPWAYVNSHGQVVGFEPELAHTLALQLGVRIEFVELQRERWIAALDSGAADIIMSGTRASARLASEVAWSQPYAHEAVAFLVEDNRRDEFSRFETVRQKALRLGTLPGNDWVEAVQRVLPRAQVVPVQSIRDFAEKKVPLDAMLTTWERACAWSLLHAELAPVAPEPGPGERTLAYMLPRDEPDLLRAVNTWIDVARGFRRFESAREYWVLGKAAQQRRPRWSVARDVLGWFAGDGS